MSEPGDQALPMSALSDAGSAGSSVADADEQLIAQMKAIGLEYMAPLGQGGMSRLFTVRNLTLDRLEAIKVLESRLLERREFIKRFQREAKAIGRLHHPNIVAVYAMGLLGDALPYISMELLAGESLRDFLDRQQKLTAEQFTALFVPLAEALAYAHQLGIIHRDIKPSNIFLTGGNLSAPKIIDFGIAQESTNAESQKLTQTGQLLGSPAYMSPEQCRSEPSDQRSDIYSLGCVMFECLYATPPYASDNQLETMFKHANEPTPPLPHNSAVPPHIESLVLSCLAKKKSDRPADAEEISTILHTATNLPRRAGHNALRRAPPALLYAAVCAALLVVAVPVTYFLSKHPAPAPADSARDSLFNEEPKLLLTRAAGALRDKDNALAESLLKQALSKSERMPWERYQICLQLCLLSSDNGDCAAALKYADLGLKTGLGPANRIELMRRRAEVYKKFGKIKEARAAYGQVNKALDTWRPIIEPGDTYDYNEQAMWTYYLEGVMEDEANNLAAAAIALAKAQEAFQLPGEEPVSTDQAINCTFRLGSVYHRLHRYKEAIPLFDKVATLAQDDGLSADESAMCTQAKILSAKCRQALASNAQKR